MIPTPRRGDPRDKVSAAALAGLILTVVLAARFVVMEVYR